MTPQTMRPFVRTPGMLPVDLAAEVAQTTVGEVRAAATAGSLRLARTSCGEFVEIRELRRWAAGCGVELPAALRDTTIAH